MEDIIRSASLGPPNSEFSASGLSPRFAGGAASGSLAVAEEFSTLHLRSSLRPGSILVDLEVLEVERCSHRDNAEGRRRCVRVGRI